MTRSIVTVSPKRQIAWLLSLFVRIGFTFFDYVELKFGIAPKKVTKKGLEPIMTSPRKASPPLAIGSGLRTAFYF